MGQHGFQKIPGTGKSLSEALIFAPTNPQYDDRLFIELQVQYMKIPSSSDKDLPVIMEDLHLLLTPIDHDQWPGVNSDPQRVNSDLQRVNSDLQRVNLEITDLYLVNLQIIDLHLANSEIIDLQLASVIQINR